jgi:DNA processing protein
MSEWEPTMVSAVWTFPHRNRLMAAMADAVLVIEAENKSGTRITAKLATDYNIDVLAVPGPIFSSTSEGTNNLIREGATPITSPEDLLSALSFEPTKTERDVRIDECSPLEQKIWNIVASPTSRDDLIRTIGAATHEITMALSVMEIKGLIKEVYGEIRRN